MGHYPVHGISALPTKMPLVHNNKPEQIDEMVALELQHLKTHYADEEQRYVDQMLLENPVVVERRPPTTRSETTSAAATASAQTLTNSRDTQRQRAESCRKSRYNNKIKKAKLRFRHKFACNQLSESAGVLDYMREVIAQAESQLLARGFNRAALERMRQSFGVDRCDSASIASMDH
ncbi:protein sisterless A [Drosophila innubila]|uniref:protein sisterless A n=1 Tax=Drosophila innubila TaxID=198719 RepID=UPI00148B3F59|nr:protein sisterless A [Drosophila innubila]